ncbi:hypothetical protein AHAS_Ahas17G0090500 [Arachis hypogaea]
MLNFVAGDGTTVGYCVIRRRTRKRRVEQMVAPEGGWVLFAPLLVLSFAPRGDGWSTSVVARLDLGANALASFDSHTCSCMWCLFVGMQGSEDVSMGDNDDSDDDDNDPHVLV